MANHNQPSSDVPQAIRSLCPEANDAELREAHENLKRYLAAVLRIYERIQHDTAETDSHDSESFGRFRDTNK